MHSAISFFTLSFLSSALPMVAAAIDDDISFSACPLIGAYYPPLTISKSSDAYSKLDAKFTKAFDDLIQNGGSEDYGPIMPNTTSFSVALFGGSNTLDENPIFFEYHYTAPEDRTNNANLTSNTKFPLGDVTMVFTVYAWLVQNGDKWETPITEYLPELARTEGSFTVTWNDITIGSLAGQMSGLSRESQACVVGEACVLESFVSKFAEKPPLFLSDTTPIVSYAAFQLLVFAMQRAEKGKNQDWADVLDKTLLQPLNMTSSGLLSHNTNDLFAMDDFNSSQIGEPGALSLVSSIEDLARAGHSILSSKLLSPAITRRWLHPNMDTSNLRNGVGRPWEVYRAASSAISPVLDALTKSGTIGQFASYFGLAPDYGAGFAILAHDSTVKDRKLDLNVHADIFSETLGYMQGIAAEEMALRYAGIYKSKEGMVALNISDIGRGLEVQKMVIGKKDFKQQTADKLGIKTADLDFRIYPTNVQDELNHQYIALFQDRTAPIDMGTPTCITWQEVGAEVELRFLFKLDGEGNAVGVKVPSISDKLWEKL